MRYTGIAFDISYEATLEFFESRGRGASPEAPQTATMYQDKTLAERRDAWERERVVPLLKLEGHERVLDIGCGFGRWAEILTGKVAEYLGVDFSGELLKLAQSRNLERCRFQRLPAQDVAAATLEIGGPFDLFICSGILIYLNDADVARVARNVAEMAGPSARVYVREPMALAERLTLDRYPSQELQQDYSAIYRTCEQCRELFGAPLREVGFKLVREEPLYPPGLCNRTETAQHIQLWSRQS